MAGFRLTSLSGLQGMIERKDYSNDKKSAKSKAALLKRINVRIYELTEGQGHMGQGSQHAPGGSCRMRRVARGGRGHGAHCLEHPRPRSSHAWRSHGLSAFHRIDHRLMSTTDHAMLPAVHSMT